MELITPEDYDSLPSDPFAKFVTFEGLCRQRMYAAMSPDGDLASDAQTRLQYMALVSAAAEECGIDGLEFPWRADSLSEAAHDFLLKASGIATRHRLRMVGKPDEYSVRLAERTRGKIEQQIEKLRRAVADSDLPDTRKKALLDKLAELSTELSQPRVRFGNVFRVLAVVGAGVVGTSSLLADAPQAISTITMLLGKDKVAEEAEAERLGLPPKPLELAKPSPALPSPERFGRVSQRDLDDEIPF